MLDARLAGCDPRSAYRAEIARGHLPPGQLGRPVIEKLLPTVEEIVAAAAGGSTARPRARSVDVRVALDDGRTLSGTVAGVRGDALRGHDVLARRRQAPPRGVGAAARADRRDAGDAVARGHDRAPARLGRRDHRRDDPRARRGTPARARRSRAPAWRRSSTSTTAGCASRCRSRARRRAAYVRALRHGGDPDARGARTRGTAAGTSGRGRRARARARPRRATIRSTTCSTRRRATTSAGRAGTRPSPRRFGRYALRLWGDLLDLEEVRDR